MNSASIHLSNVSMNRDIVQPDRARVQQTVLWNLDLSIDSGEHVGVIGANGAGKTTLLRVIAGIFSPDTGSVERVGKTSVFLDAGFGLDMRLSGRQNCESRAIVTGISKNERASFVSFVAEFSELGEYFEQPLNNYSAGMVTRLVFSMCTYEVHDILLIDEGIGTADAHFREKAFARLDEFYTRASIVVLVSHDLGLLRRRCTRGVVLKSGQIVFDGPIDEALQHYSESEKIKPD